MSDYFQRQVDRSMGRLPAIQPRLPSLCAPRDLQDGPGWVSPEEWRAAERLPPRHGMQSPEPAAAAPAQGRPHKDGRGVPRAETLEGPASDGDAVSVRRLSPRTLPVPEMPPTPADAFREPGRPVLINSPNTDAMPVRNEFTLDRDTADAPGIAKRKGSRQKTTAPTEEKPREDHSPLRGLAPAPEWFPADSPSAMQDNHAPPDPIGQEAPHGARSGPSNRASHAQVQQLPVMQPPPKPRPSPPEQTIRITIGRIDVRAVMPPTTAVQQKPSPPQPKVTLEEYLKRERGGRR